jgi:SacI homology domain
VTLKGLLTIASFSFLLCIIRREQVAQIYEKPVYVIKDVAIVPLASQTEADQSIIQTLAGLRGPQDSGKSKSESEESEVEIFDDHSVGDPSGSQTPEDDKSQTVGRSDCTTSVVQDVIQRKGGGYGRFTSQWFSRRGWGLENRSTAAANIEVVPKIDPEVQKPSTGTSESSTQDKSSPMPLKDLDHPSAAGGQVPGQISTHEAAVEMLPKILRTAKLLLTSQSFYFSYEFNITKRFASSSLTSLKLVSAESFEPRVRETPCSQRASLTVYSISGTNI